jgi:hypothetical protein
MGRQIINTGGPGPKPRDFLRIAKAIAVIIIAVSLFLIYGHH